MNLRLHHESEHSCEYAHLLRVVVLDCCMNQSTAVSMRISYALVLDCCMNLRLQHESEHSCEYVHLLRVGIRLPHESELLRHLLLVRIRLPHESEPLSVRTRVFYSCALDCRMIQGAAA